MIERTLIKNLSEKIEKEVKIMGWINVRRDQGKMIFLDIRDMTGLVQGVILPKSEAIQTGKEIREEYAVAVTGMVNKRPERNVNPNMQNGDIELEIFSIEVLNESQVLPFPINEDTRDVNEPLRFKYRYLDLRSDRLKKNIVNRHKVMSFLRNYLENEGFTEIETPLLSAPTPEGSRSYVVPSRFFHGKFFSLPQAPQQYKQLLMAAGLERYFQFARCLRDEDTRGDRQPEFTQLDLEMSYVTEEDVISLNEKALIRLIEELYPHKKIQETPFPRLSYEDVIKKYGTDKPDLRKDKNDPDLLAFAWIIDFPMFKKTDEDDIGAVGDWTFTHNPFSKPRDEYYEQFMNKKDVEKIMASQYDVVLNGYELGGGSLRSHKPEAQRNTFEIMGYSQEKIEKEFGHMLEAFSFGTPPHGGIAWGFDRLMMILENEPNIREVIAFPKTSDGKDLMMNAPSEISDTQMKELGITVEAEE